MLRLMQKRRLLSNSLQEVFYMSNEEELFDEALEGIIYLCDEDDNDIPFRYLDEIEYEGKVYAVLLPLDEEEDSEVVILEVESEEDSEFDNFNGVDDVEILTAVYELFKERNRDLLDFADEE
jgi:uncharacterized protein YrzB (UPF0473 family)